MDPGPTVAEADQARSRASIDGRASSALSCSAMSTIEEAGVGDRILLVEVAGVPFAVRVTEGAVRELRVAQGSRVFLAVKTSACRRLR